MIPWIKVDAQRLLKGVRNQRWTKGAPCPEALAHAELGLLVFTGQLASEGLRELADRWGWSPNGVRGLLKRWLGDVSTWPGGLEENLPEGALPGWGEAVLRSITDRQNQKEPPQNQPEPPTPNDSGDLEPPQNQKEPPQNHLTRARSLWEIEKGEGDPPQSPPGGAGQGGAPWSKKRKGHRWPAGTTRADVEAMVLGCLEAITGREHRVDRCATDAGSVLGLWRAAGWPPPAEFRADVALVARAARESDLKIFARDVRGEGWEGAEDRSRHVATLCVQRRWGDRLRAARAWEAAVGPAGAADLPLWEQPYRGEPEGTGDFMAVDRWLNVHAAEVAEVSAALRAAELGWAELHAWLVPRVTHPEAVLIELKKARTRGSPASAAS